MPTALYEKITAAFQRGLETERLVLRPLAPVDSANAAHFFEANGRAYRQYLQWHEGEPYTEDYMRETVLPYIIQLGRERESFTLFIFRKDAEGDNPIIGEIDINEPKVADARQISFFIQPAERRKGYAFEAYTAVLEACRQHGLFGAVFAEIEPDNIASMRLVEKAGLAARGVADATATGYEGQKLLKYEAALEKITFSIRQPAWRACLPRRPDFA